SANHEVTVLRLEDFYHGWDGLTAGNEQFSEDVLPALAAAETATDPIRDWNSPGTYRGGPGPVVTARPTEVMICEGGGVGARPNREYLDVLIWLRVPDKVRYKRAMGRDGETYRAHWDRWAAQERAMLDQDQIYDAADLVLVA